MNGKEGGREREREERMCNGPLVSLQAKLDNEFLGVSALKAKIEFLPLCNLTLNNTYPSGIQSIRYKIKVIASKRFEIFMYTENGMINMKKLPRLNQVRLLVRLQT